jgi:hypothetical protein
MKNASFDPEDSAEEGFLRPAGLQLELPPRTLVRDLGALVGDPQFADVRFVAEGRSIMAHRFILEGRSEYFRAMFRSGMTAATIEASRGATPVLNVIVPGTCLLLSSVKDCVGSVK